MRLSTIDYRLLTLLVLSACGGPATNGSGFLPREGRLAIYEAVNNLMVEKSRRDEARANVQAAALDLERLGASWTRAKTRLSKAGQASRAEEAGRVVDARRRLLELELRVARAAFAAAEAEVEAAQARVAQERVRQRVRFGQAPESRLAEHDKAVAVREKVGQAAVRRLAAIGVKAQEAFVAWKNAEDAYVAATGDHDTLVWLDR